jgi:hypothetical protein
VSIEKGQEDGTPVVHLITISELQCLLTIISLNALYILHYFTVAIVRVDMLFVCRATLVRNEFGFIS